MFFSFIFLQPNYPSGNPTNSFGFLSYFSFLATPYLLYRLSHADALDLELAQSSISGGSEFVFGEFDSSPVVVAAVPLFQKRFAFDGWIVARTDDARSRFDFQLDILVFPRVRKRARGGTSSFARLSRLLLSQRLALFLGHVLALLSLALETRQVLGL